MNLHLVPHTHWDREWYLTFQQFRLKLVHLMDGLLEILEQDPNYCHFTLDGQAIVLEDYLQMRPEKKEQLQAFIQQGRLVIGPWYILPDEFLVSPEATIRNLLEGERVCREFGPKMKVGYIPDPFGHIGQLPQILRGFGIASACLWRGVSENPCECYWQAPDGSQVLLGFLRESYSNAASLTASQPEVFYEQVKELRKALAPYCASGQMLLMYGTDHQEPDPATSRATAYTASRLQGDQLLHSTLETYFQQAAEAIDSQDIQLPILRGELRSASRAPLLPNVLSTRMWIKQRNHACETLLEKWAEPFNLWASLVTSSVPADVPVRRPPSHHPHRQPEGMLANPAPILRQAWRLLLQNHPHDSICGCSIDQVHEEMRPRFDQVEQIGEEITHQSLAALALAVDTQPPAAVGQALAAIVVFNPHSALHSDRVKLALHFPKEGGNLGKGGLEIVDEKGQPTPFAAQGLSSQELIRADLSVPDFRSALRGIHDGKIMGLFLRDFEMRREGSALHLDVTLSQFDQPDLAAYQASLENVLATLDNPELQTVLVKASSMDAIQATFLAQEMPALGLRTYWLRPAAVPPSPPEQSMRDHGDKNPRLGPVTRLALPLAARLTRSPLIASLLARLSQPRQAKPPYRIQNEYFTVEACRKTGLLTVQDLRSGAIYPGLQRFVDGGDSGDEYNYNPPAQDSLIEGARLRRVFREKNAVEETLTLHLEMVVPRQINPDRQARSREKVRLALVSRIRLARGAARLDIEAEVDNNAQDHRLRVHFPAPFQVTEANYDGHFEIVTRPLGVEPGWNPSWPEQPRPEVPQRAFTDLSNGRLGLLIANRGLPEVEVCQNHMGQSEIALTLLRCVGWLSRHDLATRTGHAGLMDATPAAQLPGKHTFQYAIIPYSDVQKDCQQAARYQGYAFQSELRAAASDLHPGLLSAQASLIQWNSPQFQLSAIKAAEDGLGWILRGVNLGDQTLEVTLQPHLPYRQAKVCQAWLSNLGEELVTQIQPQPDGIHLQATPHQIITIKFLD